MQFPYFAGSADERCDGGGGVVKPEGMRGQR
jgi:hypothetical protein